jgi:hypothetical protein
MNNPIEEMKAINLGIDRKNIHEKKTIEVFLAKILIYFTHKFCVN